MRIGQRLRDAISFFTSSLIAGTLRPDDKRRQSAWLIKNGFVPGVRVGRKPRPKTGQKASRWGVRH